MKIQPILVGLIVAFLGAITFFWFVEETNDQRRVADPYPPSPRSEELTLDDSTDGGLNASQGRLALPQGTIAQVENPSTVLDVSGIVVGRVSTSLLPGAGTELTEEVEGGRWQVPSLKPEEMLIVEEVIIGGRTYAIAGATLFESQDSPPRLLVANYGHRVIEPFDSVSGETISTFSVCERAGSTVSNAQLYDDAAHRHMLALAPLNHSEIQALVRYSAAPAEIPRASAHHSLMVTAQGYGWALIPPYQPTQSTCRVPLQRSCDLRVVLDGGLESSHYRLLVFPDIDFPDPEDARPIAELPMRNGIVSDTLELLPATYRFEVWEDDIVVSPARLAESKLRHRLKYGHSEPITLTLAPPETANMGRATLTGTLTIPVDVDFSSSTILARHDNSSISTLQIPLTAASITESVSTFQFSATDLAIGEWCFGLPGLGINFEESLDAGLNELAFDASSARERYISIAYEGRGHNASLKFFKLSSWAGDRAAKSPVASKLFGRQEDVTYSCFAPAGEIHYQAVSSSGSVLSGVLQIKESLDYYRIDLPATRQIEVAVQAFGNAVQCDPSWFNEVRFVSKSGREALVKSLAYRMEAVESNSPALPEDERLENRVVLGLEDLGEHRRIAVYSLDDFGELTITAPDIVGIGTVTPTAIGEGRTTPNRVVLQVK